MVAGDRRARLRLTRPHNSPDRLNGNQKYLHIDKQAVAFISLPAFPLGVDAARLQRVVSSMKRFGLLRRSTSFQVTSMIAG